MNKQKLMTELQSQGLQIVEAGAGVSGRKGGAGPSDHKAVTIDGTTIMVPIYTETAAQSPYTATLDPISNQASIRLEGQEIIPIEFPKTPEFYSLSTAEGIPYWKIALLHSHDVLATTVLQTCMRYRNSETVWQVAADRRRAARRRDLRGSGRSRRAGDAQPQRHGLAAAELAVRHRASASHPR